MVPAYRFASFVGYLFSAIIALLWLTLIGAA